MSYIFRQQSFFRPQTDAERQVRFERFPTRKVLKQLKALAGGIEWSHLILKCSQSLAFARIARKN